MFLNSNGHKDPYGSYDALLAVGSASSIILKEAGDAFDQLEAYQKKVADWVFGYLSYDLKNGIEHLTSTNDDYLAFPELFFFQPKKLFILTGDRLTQMYLTSAGNELESDFQKLSKHKVQSGYYEQINGLIAYPKITKPEYLASAKAMLSHIHRGNIYEANLCQEFYAQGEINALQTFQKLNAISKAPFSAYFKHEKHHILCSSPERYLCKKGKTLVSQPIKGTAKRSSDPVEDRANADRLSADPKERAENIMITDLVRNDLSRIAEKGSVQVKALCKVYPYKQVHQMISTITAQIKNGVNTAQILKSTFPMGSMTGAPKIAAMQIIEALESSKRGVYSGALGYFTPEGDFDLNVVIRSIFYHSEKKFISFSVGSAITAKAEPEKEYEECLLKAKAMIHVLSGV